MSSLMKMSMLCLATLAVGACTLQGQTRAEVEPPVGTVEITSAPVVQYESQPHTVYEGKTVYWVNGRWGYPHSNGRWAYYRSEPAPLARYRTTVQSAPPAHREYGPGSPEYAPPAARTR